MTEPYSEALNGPRKRSASAQRKEDKSATVILRDMECSCDGDNEGVFESATLSLSGGKAGVGRSGWSLIKVRCSLVAPVAVR